MRSTLVYKILSNLEGISLNRFEKFVYSGYHNSRDDLKKLISHYKKEIRKQRPMLSNQEICRAIFPNQSLNDQQLRTLYSNLLKLLNKFLFLEEVEGHEFYKKKTLAKAYAQIGQTDLFLKTLAKTKSKLTNASLRNAEHFRQLMELEQEYYNYISLQTRTEENNLQSLSDTLDVYYFSQKLQQACLMTLHQVVYRKEYDMRSFLSSLNYVENHLDIVEKYPSIGLYYYCYCAMKKEDSEKYFRLFRELLEKTKHQFDENEVRLIYLLAINYCIKRLNAGESAYVKESFELYKAGIENGSLLTGDTLSPFTYKNAVALGLGLKHYEWVENFIQDYKKNLDLNQRESSYTFNLAKLKQEQGKYEEAMSLLIHFNPDDPLMLLAAKTNLLKMYYELEEFDSLESLLNSMETYLNRKKVLSYHKKHYKNIIRFAKKMIKLPPYAIKTKDKLREEIENADMRSEKEWFLAQLS